ncbi:ATP-binding cassette domain-containing protein [Bdellovibrionota bacterium FG-2]
MTIILKSIGFEWPNGQSVFSKLSLCVEADRKYWLIGPNGIGKSTLAKLIQGELAPTTGKVQTNLQISYFLQFEAPPNTSVIEYLAHFWLHSPTETTNLLLRGINFESPCPCLSGGEWTRTRLLKQLAIGADIIVLDEPTNNLDQESKQSLLAFIQTTSMGLLMISHDRDLLERVDTILELSNQGLSIFGWNWSSYERAREKERTRLLEELDQARRAKDQAHREKLKKLSIQEQRMRQASKTARATGMPKILMGARKRRAERTLGKTHLNADREITQTTEHARSALEKLKIDQTIYADFPETAIAPSKFVFEAQDFNFKYDGMPETLWKEGVSFAMKGNSRVCLSGLNGSGKTTLLKLLCDSTPPEGQTFGRLKLGAIAYGLIDQQTSLLEDGKTVFENVNSSSRKTIIEVRNLLARFLFPGKKADQLAATLSGGERLRACLAKTMIADPAPQLLILDEPTNNVDIMNLEFLESALAKFEGAMIVISHDTTFIKNVGITEELRLTRS